MRNLLLLLHGGRRACVRPHGPLLGGATGGGELGYNVPPVLEPAGTVGYNAKLDWAPAQ